jgi:hypothetical protein
VNNSRSGLKCFERYPMREEHIILRLKQRGEHRRTLVYLDAIGATLSLGCGSRKRNAQGAHDLPEGK